MPHVFDVISIGSVSADIFVRSSQVSIVDDPSAESGRSIRMPLGAKLDVQTLAHELGGGGSNTSVCFARLGFNAAVVARVGTDPAGGDALRELGKRNVSIERVLHDTSLPTSRSVILLAPNGDRTIMVYRGTGANFHPEDIDTAWLARSRWLYVSSIGGSLATLQRVFDVCRVNPLKIAWNPGALELAFGMETLYPLLQQTDALLLNREEAAELTNLPHHSVEDVMHELIAAVGSGYVVVTNGADGASAFDGSRVASIPGRKVDVVDTTGAGDSFGSGFVAAIMRGRSMETALAFAAANAESVIGSIGAQPGLLKRDDFERITTSDIAT